MENTNKKVLYYGIAAIVVFAVIIFLVMKKGGPALTGDVDQEVDQTTGLSTEDTSTGSVNGGQKTPYITYDEALVKYKDTRIQINSGCQAFPSNVTYKNGTSIMIDNRSNVDHLVKVGTNYTVKAFGFKIIKLSSNTLPATWLVDCDKNQNVATILIQK